MGFHLFHKKEQASADVTEQAVEVQEDVQEKAPDVAPVVTAPDLGPEEDQAKGNRFTLMVEAIAQIPDNTGIAVRGVVHGRCHVQDPIYILHPGRRITKATIDEIELQGMRADYAEEQEAVIRINAIQKKEQLRPFSVLTSIQPQVKIDVNTAVENPYLLGLAQEFKKGYKFADYMNILVFELAHTNFLTPLRIMGEPEETEAGKVKYKEGAKIGFLSVKDPKNPGKMLFPLFTDWKELREWKGVFDGTHPPKTIIFTFPNVVDMMKENHSGLLINGFGKTPLVIPRDMMDKITSLEAYQKEFKQGQAEPSVQQVKIKKGTRFKVGYPAETTEIKGVQDAIRQYAKTNPDIRRVDFLLKMTEDGVKTYHCVVDCDEEKEKRAFTELFRAARPYFQEVQLLDFERYDKTTLKDTIIKDHEPLYRL